jgi:prepilin-type processing-associated H-X9-DG protein
MPDPEDRRDHDRGPRYDDHDRPRKSGGMSGLTIGLIVGAVVLLLSCVIVPILIGLLLPAVQKVREAAARAKESNNMKQIALAFHNDHDVTGKLAGPYAHDERGAVKKGLSHRVSLLPYLEQQNLYRSFDLNQEWDAGANRVQSNTVVLPYTTPLDAPSPNTPFRSFVGGGAIFNEDGSPVSFMHVTDGTSNTILFVHARDQVPWAQPKELPFGQGTPLPQLGHQTQPNGYNVAMADGSVRWVASSVSQQTLRALITRNGAEQIGPDW